MSVTELPKAWTKSGHAERTRELRALPKRVRVLLAVEWARSVLSIFEARHPGDMRPRNAIEAAQRWVHDSSEANRKSDAAAAAYAAAAYAAAADADAAAYAAAAYAAAADADAADAADAAYAAAAAAYAADAAAADAAYAAYAYAAYAYAAAAYAADAAAAAADDAYAAAAAADAAAAAADDAYAAAAAADAAAAAADDAYAAAAAADAYAAAADAARKTRWQWFYATYRHARGPSFPFDPTWRTSDAVAIARGIYESRSFDRMPILADALQDAGCDDLELMRHLQLDADEWTNADWVLANLLGIWE